MERLGRVPIVPPAESLRCAGKVLCSEQPECAAAVGECTPPLLNSAPRREVPAARLAWSAARAERQLPGLPGARRAGLAQGRLPGTRPPQGGRQTRHRVSGGIFPASPAFSVETSICVSARILSGGASGPRRRGRVGRGATRGPEGAGAPPARPAAGHQDLNTPNSSLPHTSAVPSSDFYAQTGYIKRSASWGRLFVGFWSSGSAHDALRLAELDGQLGTVHVHLAGAGASADRTMTVRNRGLTPAWARPAARGSAPS